MNTYKNMKGVRVVAEVIVLGALLAGDHHVRLQHHALQLHPGGEQA